MPYLRIMAGSALGGAARFWVGNQIGETFPWGTVIVNILGCFVIGFFFAIPDGRLLIGSAVRQFVMTGMCGGYTTSSSFSLETLNLVRADAKDSRLARHVAASALNQLKGA